MPGIDAKREADRGRHADQKRDEHQVEPAVGDAEEIFEARRAAANLAAGHADHSAQEEPAHHG